MHEELIDRILDELDARREAKLEAAGADADLVGLCACMGPPPARLPHGRGVRRCLCERRRIAEILEIARGEREAG